MSDCPGNLDDWYWCGRRTGMMQAIAIARCEPEAPGPMPWRIRIMAMLFPEWHTRAVIRATKNGIALRISGAIDGH